MGRLGRMDVKSLRGSETHCATDGYAAAVDADAAELTHFRSMEFMTVMTVTELLMRHSFEALCGVDASQN